MRPIKQRAQVMVGCLGARVVLFSQSILVLLSLADFDRLGSLMRPS
jgi:hypothetical protein